MITFVFETSKVNNSHLVLDGGCTKKMNRNFNTNLST